MSFTETWDKTKPIDHTKFIQQPGYIRELKRIVEERLTDSLYGLVSGETDDSLVGNKKLILREQASSPTYITNGGLVFTKDVDGVDELFFLDSADNELQLTTGGAINLDAVLLTGAQTIADVKTFSSFPVTPSSAPSTDYQMANKKYIDDLIDALDISTVAQRIKGYAQIDSDGTINGHMNVSSVTHNGTGDYTVAWDTDFENGYYTAVMSTYAINICGNVHSPAAGSVDISTWRRADGAAIDSKFYIIAIGNQ